MQKSGPVQAWRRLLTGTLAATALTAGGAAFAGPDVGVSVSISQPGVYGRIDIGQFPQPQVVVAQPVIIAQPRVRPEPVYMWVPPGHRKNWRKHCGHYNACGVPVYFVQDGWYHDHVDRRDRRDDRGDRGDWDRRDDNRRGHDDDHGHGHGNKHGRGHGSH